MAFSRDSASTIRWAISLIDAEVAKQLDSLLHHASSQKLEATWSALHLLLSQIHDLPDVKVRVLNVSKEELLRDFQRSAGFDQAILFKKIYDDVGIFGGVPCSLMVGAHKFSDIRTMSNCWRTFYM